MPSFIKLYRKLFIGNYLVALLHPEIKGPEKKSPEIKKILDA
jgi:hypothetical protein